MDGSVQVTVKVIVIRLVDLSCTAGYVVPATPQPDDHGKTICLAILEL